jgi:hypothetical protein
MRCLLHFLFRLELQLEDVGLSYPCLFLYVAYVMDVINFVTSHIHL